MSVFSGLMYPIVDAELLIMVLARLPQAASKVRLTCYFKLDGRWIRKASLDSGATTAERSALLNPDFLAILGYSNDLPRNF